MKIENDFLLQKKIIIKSYKPLQIKLTSAHH